MKELDKEAVSDFQIRLLNWFSHEGRQYPWRETTEPYPIMLAEKLLQQTSVREAVVRAHTVLLEQYPSISDLAQATIEDILDIIKPLGLHYRAGEIITLARAIDAEFDGVIPHDLQTLLTLPGVGQYTARAVLCFAYGQNVPVIDTNVSRILYRVFELPGNMPANPARKRTLIELSEKLLPGEKARDFNLAMIDLGALVCKPAKPHCEECPLNTLCSYHLNQPNEN